MTLDLNCAKFSDKKGKAPSFPPDGLKKHPVSVNRSYVKALKEKLGKTGTVVFEAHDGGLVKEGNER